MGKSRRRPEHSKQKMEKGRQSRTPFDFKRQDRTLKRKRELPPDVYTSFLEHQSDPPEW